ncbi:MAG TPA: hypothetical protein VIJ71_01510 [Mycobacteriales bacterium]
MNDPETLLRQHFSAVAADIAVDVDLLGSVDGLRRLRRRRRFVAGGSALAVVMIAAAIAVPLAVVGHHGDTVRVTVSPNQLVVPTTPPPNERAVTWAGIQFYVPAGWLQPLSLSSPCALPSLDRGVVTYPSDTAIAGVGCTPPAHPVLQQLQFGDTPIQYTGGPDPVLAPSGALCPGEPSATPQVGELGGLSATCSRGWSRGQWVTTVQVSAVASVYVLTTNTRTVADSILASAHRVSVDENGCVVAQPRDIKTVVGGGSGGPEVTGQPVKGVVCSYARGRLLVGETLSATQLARITGDLNRLPARYTPAELAAQKVPSPLEGGGLASMLLTDAAGRTQQVTVQGLQFGVVPGVAGATQSTLTQALSADLSEVLPTGFGSNAYQQGPTAQLPPG